jgi:predicted nucleic acid-binding Zn ribbon protein
MYCTNCGAWNPEESKFCAKCGRPLEEASQAQRGRPRPLVSMAMAGVLLVLAVVCVMAYAMRDRLSRAWQVLAARPTEVIVLPTASPTQVPVQVTATPTATAMPSPSATASQVPTPTLSPAPTETPTPRPRTFRLVYGECVPHGFSLGSVKGQVFDKGGKVIPGAKVRITINGYQWDSEANPATTNGAGWYEWTLEVGQKVQFVELIVDGKSVPFAPQGFEVKATGSCFQRVDFVEQ